MKKITVQEQLNKGGFVLIENQTHYYVNKKGEVASTWHGNFKLLKQYSNRPDQPEKGYLFVDLGYANPTYVHRLVWETFVGPIPKGYDIHHKQNKHLNSLENLECVEQSLHRSEANRGKVLSEETRKKMSQAKKKSKKIQKS